VEPRLRAARSAPPKLRIAGITGGSAGIGPHHALVKKRSFRHENRHHSQALKGWFVMVRDSKYTHPGNNLWGDGWGWSWFGASNPTKTTSTDYKVNYLGCHVPAQATEWIYVNGYPPLRG
jgi:hypothetical protein